MPYTHVRSDLFKTALSFSRGINDPSGIMGVYANRILVDRDDKEMIDICLDYVETVISWLYKKNNRKLEFHLVNIHADSAISCDFINAEGTKIEILNEWDKLHNSKVHH